MFIKVHLVNAWESYFPKLASWLVKSISHNGRLFVCECPPHLGNVQVIKYFSWYVQIMMMMMMTTMTTKMKTATTETAATNLTKTKRNTKRQVQTQKEKQNNVVAGFFGVDCVICTIREVD